MKRIPSNLRGSRIFAPGILFIILFLFGLWSRPLGTCESCELIPFPEAFFLWKEGREASIKKTFSCQTDSSASCYEVYRGHAFDPDIYCSLYFGDGVLVSSCPEIRIGVCNFSSTLTQKIYQTSGSIAWNSSSAQADCTSLGGSFQ